LVIVAVVYAIMNDEDNNEAIADKLQNVSIYTASKLGSRATPRSGEKPIYNSENGAYLG
jgi:hypothetical protein